MLNELHQLSVAMDSSGIQAENWHREYKPLPNVRPNAPCIRIVLSGGRVARLESVSGDMAAKLRKFGNNQGSFPAMNLAPLYRIGDAETGKQLSACIKKQGEGLRMVEVKSWCVQNNWGEKFSKKYRISMENVPKKLAAMLTGPAENESVLRLIEETRLFASPEVLHAELEREAFAMLERKWETALALQVLFYVGKPRETPETDYGSLSVILDLESLEDDGMPAAGVQFTRALNRSLLLADAEAKSQLKSEETDAFGLPFAPLSEPMPMIKLAGGFDVSLRTMFKGQPCQYRYHLIENDTYPISAEMRTRMQTALSWLSAGEKRDKTWMNTDSNEILFAYPSRLPDAVPEFVSQFGSRKQQDSRKKQLFETEAAAFSAYISKTRERDPEHYPEHIQIFILRKLDKARTKAVYARNTTPDELIARSDDWRKAVKNLPPLPGPLHDPWTPFPLEIARIMNRVWKQDGTLSQGKYKPADSYHGMELLFGVTAETLDRDMRLLADNTGGLAVYAGSLLNPAVRQTQNEKAYFAFREQAGLTLALMGMLLHWRGIRKDDYVNEYPYLLGQMLKASDSLHELYCWVVREQSIPPQLAGNSLYVFASESPYRALAQLGHRMMPYLAWARKNRDARIAASRRGKDGESVAVNGPSAGYLLSVYEKTANRLCGAITPQTRFSDYEKAQLFIGYLASFPRSAGSPAENESADDLNPDNTENYAENGGTEHD